jgi:hypothetical protein
VAFAVLARPSGAEGGGEPAVPFTVLALGVVVALAVVDVVGRWQARQALRRT